MADWTNTCQVCGAEEGLDVLILRMIDDDTVRRLIHDTLKLSLPLGAQLMRYIRLHKPPKQRLRMARLQELLTELVTDMQRNVIERHGRAWTVCLDDWRGAFDAVFAAVDKGTLQLPLQGNGYLYQVLTRKADQAEATQEAQREQDRRTGPRAATTHGPASVADLMQGVPAPATARPAPAAPAPAGTSPLVRAMRAQLNRTKGETP